MIRTFTPDTHSREAFIAAVTEFVHEIDYSPLEVLRSREQFDPSVVERADYLDDWDIWLFRQ
jgi:hypothetical protein